MYMHMAKVLFPQISILVFARLLALSITILVASWAFHFKTSFINPQQSPPSSREDLIYAALHPLLMVIGLILISGEAILVHRWLNGPRNKKKLVHLCLHGVALSCGIFGIWTRFQGQRGIVANFYSLHSWMGLICISMFATQWVLGFMSFWHRVELRTTRLRTAPWHVFLGLYTYGLAVITAETGLVEKITFLQNASRQESIVVNGLGIGLALLSSVVIVSAVSPKHHQSSSKGHFQEHVYS